MARVYDPDKYDLYKTYETEKLARSNARRIARQTRFCKPIVRKEASGQHVVYVLRGCFLRTG